MNSFLIYEKGWIYNTLVSRNLWEGVFNRTLHPIFGFPHISIANMSLKFFCIYFCFKLTQIVNPLYIHKVWHMYNPLESRSLGESHLKRTLRPIMGFPHISIGNMSFSLFSIYFWFKCTHVVNSFLIYEKGWIYNPLVSRSLREGVFNRNLHPIFGFPHLSISNMSI